MQRPSDGAVVPPRVLLRARRRSWIDPAVSGTLRARLRQARLLQACYLQVHPEASRSLAVRVCCGFGPALYRNWARRPSRPKPGQRSRREPLLQSPSLARSLGPRQPWRSADADAARRWRVFRQGRCVAAIQGGSGAGALLSIEGVLPSSGILIFFWLLQACRIRPYRVGHGDGQGRVPLLTRQPGRSGDKERRPAGFGDRQRASVAGDRADSEGLAACDPGKRGLGSRPVPSGARAARRKQDGATVRIVRSECARTPRGQPDTPARRRRWGWSLAKAGR